MTMITRALRSWRPSCGLCGLAAVLVAALPAPARAQPDTGGAASQESIRPAGTSAGHAAGAVPDDIRDVVAAKLLARARLLQERGDHPSAKDLVVECLELSPKGSHAASARELLRAINSKLGVADLDSGAPAAASGSPRGDLPGSPDAAGTRPGDGSAGDAPLDPYASDTPSSQTDAAGEGPLDPYGSSAGGEPLTPGNPDPGDGTGNDKDKDGKAGSGASADMPDHKPSERGRRQLMVTSGLFGFVAGAALGGPTDELGQVRGGAVALSVLGLVSGMGLGNLAHGRYQLTDGQAATIAWSTVLGTTSIGFLGDALTGIDSSTTNELTRSMALGGLAGLGVGTYLARKHRPSAGDVALVSSLGLYGMVGGLLLGEVMQPPESEAYSINAFIGTALGLSAGYLAAQRVDTTPERMLWVDLAAAVGVVAPWVLIYPLGGGSTDARQAAGLLSMATLVAGAYVGWRRTAGMDETAGEADTDRGGEDSALLVPGLIQRTATGRWTLGMIGLRPAEHPLLAPATGRPGMAVDLLGGRF